jgi:hypothetical protein
MNDLPPLGNTNQFNRTSDQLLFRRAENEYSSN